MFLFDNYPIGAFIRIVREGAIEGYYDTAKEVTDKDTGKVFYRLKKLKDNVDSIHFKNLIRTNKGLFVTLYSPAPGQYIACKFTDVEKKRLKNDKTGKWKDIEVPLGKPLNVDRANFYADQIDMKNRIWAPKKSMLEKFMPLILIMVTVMTVVLLLWAFSQYAPRLVAESYRQGGVLFDSIKEEFGARLFEACTPPIA